MGDGTFPTYPTGFRRRIAIHPGHGWIGGALEDDMHHFLLRLDHDGARISGAAARALRHPWSGCAGAPDHIVEGLVGLPLAEVAAQDPSAFCTHLIDLAVLLAAHAGDGATRTFDMTVADRVEGRTSAMLAEDGALRLTWRLDGTALCAPGDHAGQDLRQLSRWKHDLEPAEAERAGLLRRAVFVSGVRAYKPPPGTLTANESPGRMGVCFNYQLPQAATSTRNPDWHTDFSRGGREPLDGFNPAMLEELAAAT